MFKKYLQFLIVTSVLCLIACTSNVSTQSYNPEHSDKFYHYSIWYGFVNMVFEGNLTVSELKKQGDIGLGSYSLLDGELIMLDGKSYQAREDGSVLIASDSQKIVYANATFFDVDQTLKIAGSINYDTLINTITNALPSQNMFYAFKIKGKFDYIKLGGLHRQEKPFMKGLDVLIPNRPIFEGRNVQGTLVGFFCPDFIGNINVAGFHFHFISNDEKLGGHAMEFETKSLEVNIDEMNEYNFVLPDTEAYRNVGFEKEFQYKKK